MAEGGALARRFPPDIGPFAAVSEISPQGFAALAALMSPSDYAVLFTPDPVTAPAEFKILLAKTGEQMIGMPAEPHGSEADIVTLGAGDVHEMMTLTKLTNPGPFAARTHELGTFLGVKVGGRLVAMAGERMKPADYTEITAVCVHPDHRGRGYAQVLLASHRAADCSARGDPVPARLFRQRRRHRAIPAAGHGNPAAPACDRIGEEYLTGSISRSTASRTATP